MLLMDETAPTHREASALAATYPAGPASVGAIRDDLAAFARDGGACERQVEAVCLAASEAATNAIVHAYEPQVTGLVHVGAEWQQGMLTIIVEDTGRGIQAGPRRLGLGAGLRIIARLADDVALSATRGGGLRVVMRFQRCS
jgi:anti-sigma regulatory factor (Ser/Thr protein kinase)